MPPTSIYVLVDCLQFHGVVYHAIRLPQVPADARPRESVETRAFVFYR
jgi:hypothetical protein